MSDLTNMKVEDRLAEKLKGADFAQWFGEDDLRELVGKALDLAFFKPRVTVGNYRTDTAPAIIVEVATKAVGDRVDQLVLDVLRERLAAEPATLADIVAKLAQRSIEDLILSALMRTIKDAMQLNEFDISNRVGELLRQASR